MKTVKVRIALAVDQQGEWACAGWGKGDKPASDKDAMGCAIDSIGEGEARYWIETEVSLPEPQTIQAEARPA